MFSGKDCQLLNIPATAASNTDELIESLRTYLAHLETDRERLLLQLEWNAEAMTKMSDALSFLTAATSPSPTIANAASQVMPEETEQDSPEETSSKEKDCETRDNKVICGLATVADISGCSTQREAMYVIAKRNGGIFKLPSAAALVVAAGLSRSTDRTVAGSLHTYLSKNPDFEYAGPNQFRLKSATADEESAAGDEAVLENSVRKNGVNFML